MKVVVTDEAEADFERIGDYIMGFDVRRAGTFVRELTDACIGLGDMPHRLACVPRYETSGIRRRPHGKYLIFYRIRTDEVQILHVLHGAQDYEAVLFPAH